MKFEKGQKVIVNGIMDSEGIIATEPVKVKDSICYGIIFKNPEHNKLFNIYYI